MWNPYQEQEQETAEQPEPARVQRVLYMEIAHDWNGEISYFAETVPAEISDSDWHSGIWINGGFDAAVHSVRKFRQIR